MIFLIINVDKSSRYFQSIYNRCSGSNPNSGYCKRLNLPVANSELELLIYRKITSKKYIE